MARNRLTALLLTVLLLLCAASCASKDPPGDASSQPSQSEPAVSAIAPTPDPEPEPVPEPEPEFPFVNPLTGQGSETDVGKNRPIAIMLNNLKKALPQMGVSQADVIYEIPAEGGITRMLAVFQDISDVGQLGTVRSARDYYVSIAYGHDALFLHAGGSPQAYFSIKNLGVTALDCVNGPYEGTLYWRDAARRKSAGLEHSVVTSGEKIQQLLPTYTQMRLEHKDGFTVGWEFAEELTGSHKRADQITVTFSPYKTGEFLYDGDTQSYFVKEYGQPYVDGNTSEQVAVKNVLVLYTDISQIQGDTAGRLKVRTTGSGKGLLARDGQMVPITWKRDSESDRFSFCLESGQTAQLAPGNSYINIVKTGTDVTWE